MGHVLALHDAATQLPPAAFFQEAITRLQPLLGHDAACIGSGIFDPGAGREEILQVDLQGRPLSKLADRANFVGPDPVLAQGLQRPGEMVQIDARAHPSILARPDLQRHAQLFEVKHTLTLVNRQGPANIEVMTLWRGARQAYRPQHRARAQALAAHLLLARRTCYQLQARQGPAGDTAPDAAYAFCTKQGHIRFASPGFHSLLIRAWPRHEGWTLPDPLQRYLQGVDGQLPCHPSTLVRITAMGELFRVALQGQTLDLSPAEWAVAKLVASHWGDKAIARLLDKSPATVRNQLHAIYQKLGLTGRMALASLVNAAALPGPR